jgi:hypothetical protein
MIKLYFTFILLVCSSFLFAQESPERINEVFRAYSMVNLKQDSIQSNNDRLADKVSMVTYREELISSSGKSGLASVLVSLGTSIGSLALAVQGETSASYVLSVAGQTVSAILLARSFVLLSKAGEELANERLEKESIPVN